MSSANTMGNRNPDEVESDVDDDDLFAGLAGKARPRPPGPSDRNKFMEDLFGPLTPAPAANPADPSGPGFGPDRPRRGRRAVGETIPFDQGMRGSDPAEVPKASNAMQPAPPQESEVGSEDQQDDLEAALRDQARLAEEHWAAMLAQQELHAAAMLNQVRINAQREMAAKFRMIRSQLGDLTRAQLREPLLAQVQGGPTEAVDGGW